MQMPLAMAAAGEEVYIKRIGGKEETRRFLENLGFVCDGTKRTTNHTLSAGNTKFTVNTSALLFIIFDGIHATGCCTRSHLM